jgi:hypothetical protein
MTAGWSARYAVPKGHFVGADQHFSPQGVGEAGSGLPKGQRSDASPNNFRRERDQS